LLDIPYDVGFQLIKWVYTDEIVEKQNEDFLLTLMKIAKRFELKELIDQFVYFHKFQSPNLILISI
jgi:hypothetical protein